MSGIFARPRRSVLPTLSQGQSEFPVRTDAELRSAIRTIAARGSSGDGGAFGCRITILAPIICAAPYVLPAACGGMEITSAGRVPIIPKGLVGELFQNFARALRLIALLVEATATNNATTFYASKDQATQHITIRDCIVNADRFIADTGGRISNSHVVDNTIAAVTAGAVPTVESASSHVRYHGNRHLSAVASKAVLLDAGAASWSIVGNEFAGRGVDTSAGATSVISSNVLAGAIASAGSDAVGLNT